MYSTLYGAVDIKIVLKRRAVYVIVIYALLAGENGERTGHTQFY
jgi:hypothetical protein